MASESGKIKLKYPFKHAGMELTEITLRRPKVKDYLTAKKVGGNDDSEAEIALFASLTGVEPNVLEELDMLDYKKLQEVYQGFLS